MGLIMLVIAGGSASRSPRGCRSAWALVEYLILVGLAIAGLVFVLSHQPGTVRDHQGLVQPGPASAARATR